MVLVLVAGTAAAQEEEDADLVLFYGAGCPHCAAERIFLAGLQEEFPELVVVEYEVYNDAANQDLFRETLAGFGMEPRAVPTTIVAGRVWVGFSDAMAAELRQAAAEVLAGRPAERAEDEEDEVVGSELVHVPLLGDVEVAEQSLLVSTIVIGFVDGFNPCSLWVLSILLALVLRSGSRRRIVAVGVTFLVVTTLLYGFYIAGLYSVLSYVAYVSWIRVAVALVALAFGLVNLKDFFWFKRGISLTIPDARKPAIVERARSLAVTDRPLPGMLAGTAALAVGVSLIETPCTAGLPVLWTSLVTEADVALGVAVLLFAVYMLVFLLDELAVLGMAVVTMRAAKLQERHGRLLKLAGGSVMVALAIVMLAAPDLMESLSGALAVFAGAAGLTLVLVLIDRARGGAPSSRRPPARSIR